MSMHAVLGVGRSGQQGKCYKDQNLGVKVLRETSPVGEIT